MGAQVRTPDPSALLFLFEEVWLERDYFLEVAPTPGPVFIDAGANVGLATLYLCAVYPGATVTAFEPNPAAAAALRTTIALNGLEERVRLHEVALGATAGPATLYGDADRGASLTASLMQGRGAATSSIEVEVRPLSPFVPEHVDLLKLDVEGAEDEVLAELEASGALERIRAIICEVHEDPTHRPDQRRRVTEILRRAGFTIEVRSVRPDTRMPDTPRDTLLVASRRSARPNQ